MPASSAAERGAVATAGSARHAMLPDALLQEIIAAGGVQRYPANAVLITENDAAQSLFIVLSGRVKVYSANPAGREVILDVHGPGAVLGELALDGGVRSASVMTVEPCTCAVISADRLRDFIVRHPDFALHFIQTLIQRVRWLTGSVKSLALEDVYVRVVKLLKRRAVPEAALQPDGSTVRVVPERLTQQDIAEHVGASREMVNRIFKELTRGGYLSTERGRIRLLRPLPAAW